jgi:DNA-binding transcriptional ArsR family regulator
MAYHAALTALSDPMRRTILERIVAAPRSVGEIAQDLPISRPAVSQHLKVLKEAELVRDERAGARRIYYADSGALGELRAYVDDMWRAALGSFSAAAKEGEKQ